MIMEAHFTRKCASKFVYRIFLTPGIFFRIHVRMNETRKMPRVRPIKTNGLYTTISIITKVKINNRISPINFSITKQTDCLRRRGGASCALKYRAQRSCG